MTKTMEEINAEKRSKPRPDLIPARVLRRLYSAKNGMLGRAPVPIDEALLSLLAFADTGDLADLDKTLVHLFDALGADVGTQGRLLRVGAVLSYGLSKHGVCTWRVPGTEQADPQTHYASALRHILEYKANRGAREEGSGLPVLDHALTQLFILADLVLDPPSGEPGVNDGRWAISAARDVAHDSEPELPVGYSWAVDKRQKRYQEFITRDEDGHTAWFDDEGRLRGLLKNKPDLVALLRQRHGVSQ